MSNGPNVTFHYLYFNYFVLNITLPLLSSTISRLMGLTHCHQVLEPSSSSVPCFARLPDTAEVSSTLQTVVIQYEAGGLIIATQAYKMRRTTAYAFYAPSSILYTPSVVPRIRAHNSPLQPSAVRIWSDFWNLTYEVGLKMRYCKVELQRILTNTSYKK